jgi:hypothetical protein
VAVAVNTELNDISNAIGALDQSYFFTQFVGTDNLSGAKNKSNVAGSRFDDGHHPDDCDQNSSCDLVCGAPGQPTNG